MRPSSPRRSFFRTLTRFRRSALFAVAVSALASLAGATAVSVAAARTPSRGWTTEQRTLLRSLSLSSLGPLAADASNKYADDPRAAGRRNGAQSVAVLGRTHRQPVGAGTRPARERGGARREPDAVRSRDRAPSS